MNLLASTLYDPSTVGGVTKATSSLLAMTALDTTNLRLAITVPAHGKVLFRAAVPIVGATTSPVILLGVLNGVNVIGRVTPRVTPVTAPAATQVFHAWMEFTATGLTPGAMNVDLAYAVQVVVASTNIKYGGANTNAGNNAWGGVVFEAWDPQPLTAALDGGVNVKQINSVTAATPGAAGGVLISGSNAGTTTLGALTVTGVTTHTGNVVLSDGLTISAPSTGNRAGLDITGNGTGAAIKATGGATGIGLNVVGGGTSGDGIKVTTTSGHGINLAPVGASMHGLLATGGNSGTSDGIKAAAGTGGVDFRANQTGNLTGTVATLTTYTGNTPQTGDAFARLGAPAGASVSADVAAVKADTAAVKVKTDFLPSATAGAAGGVLISGSNAGTTTLAALTITGVTTHTGNVVLSDGLTISSPSTGNRAGLSVTGNGSGAAVALAAGATGKGIAITTTAGDGLSILPTAGDAIVATGNGTSKHGIRATGGTAGTSDGAAFIAGTGGVDFRANQTGNLTGTVATLTTYTGNTPQTGDAFARLGAPAGASVSADVAAVKADTAAVKLKTDNLPAAPASTTNITAGTITTATNLTNAPTAGDFTAAMKTSIGTAVAASAVASVTGNVGGNVTGSVGSVVGAVGSVTGLTASDVGAIKASTDNLPSDPADESLVIAATNAIMARIGVDGANLTALGDTRLANLDAAISTRSTFAGGAVASVTGNIGGNVVGSVASVVAAVSVTGDLSATMKASVTTAATAATPTAAGVTGLVVANLDAAISTRLASASYAAPLDAAGTRGAVGLASANLDTQLAALPTGDENADALLLRNVAGGSSSGRLVCEALFVLRNRVAIADGTLTVYQVDDVTAAFTATVSTTAGNPISQLAPVG